MTLSGEILERSKPSVKKHQEVNLTVHFSKFRKEIVGDDLKYTYPEPMLDSDVHSSRLGILREKAISTIVYPAP